MVISCFYVNTPNITETNLWLSGTLTYQIPLVLLSYSLIFYLRRSITSLFTLLIILPFNIGSNETLFQIPSFLIFLEIINDYKKTKSFYISDCLILLCTIILVATMYLAPGNGIRKDQMANEVNLFILPFKNILLLFDSLNFTLLRSLTLHF